MTEKFIRPSKDEYFKEIVQVVAKRSTCNHAQVGALLVSPNGQLLSTGYNGAVSGMPHCSDIGCTEDKYGHCVATVHAEQNAIAQAAKHGVSPEVAILYTTLFPCLACLKLVVAAGVKEIKYIDEYHAKDPYEELLIDTLEISCNKIWLDNLFQLVNHCQVNEQFMKIALFFVKIEGEVIIKWV